MYLSIYKNNSILYMLPYNCEHTLLRELRDAIITDNIS